MQKYKVFLADDEATMRTGIRNNIDWDNSNFILAGEAPDGEMALPLMQEIMPDILITDVRMPFMDGIELSRKVKRTMPWIRIIILSGHDEFEYAKQAITIGVEEYLLKPVTSERLMKTLEEVACRIEEDKEKSKNVENLINDSKKNQTQSLLSDLLYGNITLDKALTLADELNLSILSDYYLIMLIELHVSSAESYNYSYHSAFACISGVLNDWEDNVFFNQGLDRIVCVLKGKDPAALEEDAYACAQAMKYEVERNEPFTVSVAIGSIVSDINEWSKSLTNADMAKRYLNLINRKQIISIRDINISGLIPFAETNKLSTIDKLRYAAKADIPRFLDDYFENSDNTFMISFLFMNYIFVDVLMSASKIIEEFGGNASSLISEYSNIGELLASTSDVENIKTILINILEKTIDFRDSATGSKYNDIIAKAQKYIQENYCQQDISLHTVAREVNISPNHFSTIFRQETGETFINYITKIRIDHAKTLLKTTQMRTSDIGYQVGYNDTHYFSYVFKKNTGMTPKEFRK